MKDVGFSFNLITPVIWEQISKGSVFENKFNSRERRRELPESVLVGRTTMPIVRGGEVSVGSSSTRYKIVMRA